MADACGCHHEHKNRDAATRLASRTVAEVVAGRPDWLELMKSLGINHCCGAHLTLTEAAASAGLPLERLLAALGESTREQADGSGVGESPVVVDVRDEIARGGEPFERIMSAVKTLGPDQTLVLRAPFEPVPLYGVLGKRGFAHRTERRDASDWWITFFRPAETATVTLDVRGLEPPHPMVRVLERLDGLPQGTELVVLHERRPLFLYPQLEARGYVHETDEPEPGLVRIRIRHRVDDWPRPA